MADETVAEPGTEPDQAEAPAPALSESSQEILERLERALGDAIVEHGAASGDLVLRIRPDSWRQAAQAVRSELDCDYLSFVSAVDWMPRPSEGDDAGGDTSAPVQPQEMTYGVAGSAGRLQLLARVASTSRKWGVTLKCDVDEAAPSAQSWVGVYPGADWHERETWEMFGIGFDGHPRLRHIYLPAEFEGNPLRKDFPLLAREVKPWPGLVDVEDMPAGDTEEAESESDGEGES